MNGMSELSVYPLCLCQHQEKNRAVSPLVLCALLHADITIVRHDVQSSSEKMVPLLLQLKIDFVAIICSYTFVAIVYFASKAVGDRATGLPTTPLQCHHSDVCIGMPTQGYIKHRPNGSTTDCRQSTTHYPPTHGL